MIGIVRYRHILFLITRINVHNVRDFIKQNATVHTIRDAVCACTFGWNEQLTSNEQYTRSVVVASSSRLYMYVYMTLPNSLTPSVLAARKTTRLYSLSLSLSRFPFLAFSFSITRTAPKRMLANHGCVAFPIFFVRKMEKKEWYRTVAVSFYCIKSQDCVTQLVAR